MFIKGKGSVKSSFIVLDCAKVPDAEKGVSTLRLWRLNPPRPGSHPGQKMIAAVPVSQEIFPASISKLGSKLDLAAFVRPCLTSSKELVDTPLFPPT